MIVPKDKKLDKFGGWEWMEYSKKAWQFWCDENGYELVIYNEPSIEDTMKYRITVQRWFDIFDFLVNIFNTFRIILTRKTDDYIFSFGI